jgi:hypothetical protein
LFAQDALQGLRLIDLCREVFDVVVMNPPFGALAAIPKTNSPKPTRAARTTCWPFWSSAAWNCCALADASAPSPHAPAFFLSSFQKWREQVVLGIAKPEVMADLGHGVMDDAMVEAAAYVLEKQHEPISAALECLFKILL